MPNTHSAGTSRATLRAVVLVVGVALVLSACGRKSDLVAPGTVEQPRAQTTIVPGTAPQAVETTAPPVEDRRFFLDRLID
jgi:predicted small lipoprotein YifL